MKSNKGFTLIELLVVIAIIGILSSFSLVSLQGARDRAKDVRIIVDVSQIRTLAEIVFISDGNYDNLACSGGEQSVAVLCDDVTAQGSSLVVEKPSLASDKYCVYAKLIAPSTDTWYCVDSTLVAKQSTQDPSSTCGTGVPVQYVCP